MANTVYMWRKRDLLPEARWTVSGRLCWNWPDVEKVGSWDGAPRQGLGPLLYAIVRRGIVSRQRATRAVVVLLRFAA